MPKLSFSSTFSQADDAGFRAWWQDMRTLLAGCGLVQTSDSGQLDPVTMTRPVGTSVFAGYEIWRFDDALQGVSPIFLRIRPGVSAAITRPTVELRVGTATDGAGTLQGAYTSAFLSMNNQEINSTSTPYRSRGCGGPGFFWLSLKEKGISGTNSPLVIFSVERTVDNNGFPTPFGFVVRFRSQSNNTAQSIETQQVRALAPEGVGAPVNMQTSMTFIPHNLADSKVDPATGGPGLSPQVFVQWYAMPKQMPLVAWATYLSAEIADDVEFDLALVGTTPRHYIALGILGGVGGPNGNYRNCVLWED